MELTFLRSTVFHYGRKNRGWKTNSEKRALRKQAAEDLEKREYARPIEEVESELELLKRRIADSRDSNIVCSTLLTEKEKELRIADQKLDQQMKLVQIADATTEVVAKPTLSPRTLWEGIVGPGKERLQAENDFRQAEREFRQAAEVASEHSQQAHTEWLAAKEERDRLLKEHHELESQALLLRRKLPHDIKRVRFLGKVKQRIESVANRELQRKLREARLAALDGESRSLAGKVRPDVPNNHRCPYCLGPLGEPPHLDHIVPVSHGGLSVMVNLVFACSDCNGKKTNLTIREFCEKYSRDRTSIEKELIALGKRV